MNIKSIGFYIAIIGIIVFILNTYSRIIEPFQTNSDISKSPSEQITEGITFISEIICPAFNEIYTNKLKEKIGTEDEKRRIVLYELEKESGGPLFTCPPPNDPLQIPADIDKRILITSMYLKTQLEKNIDKINKSLNCEKVEDFQDICTPELEAEKNKLEEEARIANAVKTCKKVSTLTEEDKKMLLETRLNTMNRVLSNENSKKLFSEITVLTSKLKDIKQQAESGQLTPNCG